MEQDKDLRLAKVFSRSLTTVLRYSCNDKFRSKCFQAFGVSNSDEFQDACEEIVLSSITPLVPLPQASQVTNGETIHNNDMPVASQHETQETPDVFETGSLTQDYPSSQCTQQSIQDLSQTSEAPILSQLLHFDDVDNENNNCSQITQLLTPNTENNNIDDIELPVCQYVTEAMEMDYFDIEIEDASSTQCSQLQSSKQNNSQIEGWQSSQTLSQQSSQTSHPSQFSEQGMVKNSELVTLETNPQLDSLPSNATDCENGDDLVFNDKIMGASAEPTAPANNNDTIIPNLDSETFIEYPQHTSPFTARPEFASPEISILLKFDDRMETIEPLMQSKAIDMPIEESQINNTEYYSSLKVTRNEALVQCTLHLTETDQTTPPTSSQLVHINENVRSIMIPHIETSESNDTETAEVNKQGILNLTGNDYMSTTSSAVVHNNDIVPEFQQSLKQLLSSSNIPLQQNAAPTLSQLLHFKKTITLDKIQNRITESGVREKLISHGMEIHDGKETLDMDGHIKINKDLNCKYPTCTHKQNYEVIELKQSQKCEHCTDIHNRQGTPPTISQLLHFNQNAQPNTSPSQKLESSVTGNNAIELNEPTEITDSNNNSRSAWKNKHAQSAISQKNHPSSLRYEHPPTLLEITEYQEEKAQEIGPQGLPSTSTIIYENNANYTHQIVKDGIQISDEELVDETESSVSYNSSTSLQQCFEDISSSQSIQRTTKSQQSSSTSDDQQEYRTGVHISQPASPILTELLMF